MPGGTVCPGQSRSQLCPSAPYFGPANPDGTCPKGVPSCINVSTTIVDEAVLRILTPMYEFDVFKHAAQWSNLTKRSLTVTSAAHSLLAREIAAAATVLLRNEEETLPIASSVRSIVVLGKQAESPSVHGGGSGAVLPTYVISPLQGICEKANASGVSCVYDPGDDLEKSAARAASADLAIVVVGDSSSEGKDRSSLAFSGTQNGLVTTVAGKAKRTVVVGLNPGPVLLPWAEQVDGLLLMFTPGLECGHALADILWNDAGVNPSGRLPLTMPASENQVGFTTEQYPGTPNEQLKCLTSNYSEQLLIGYRWYDHHKAEPRFEFGYGLSYTQFHYSDLTAAIDTVSFTLTNNGSRPGAEVAQLYLSFPESAGEPPQQLKAFKKVHLDVGVATSVVLNLTARSFSIWSVEQHAWTPVKGTFRVSVGSSSRDTRLTGTISYVVRTILPTARLATDDASVRRRPAVPPTQHRIQLMDAAIIVNASELAYVKYAADDLGSFLHSLAPSVTPLVTTSINVVANSSTIIAIGAAAASALGVDVSSISKLGKDESMIYSDKTNDGRTVVVVAGLDPHGTNTGVATLLRAIEVDPTVGPYTNGPLNTTNRPSYLKRGLHLNGWPLKYPYSFRVWKEADWKRFIDIAWVQRINLFYLWPFMEIIPLPLSTEDRSYLQEVRRVVDYAQNKRGMEVWIFQSANRIGVSDCSSVNPRERQYWVMGKTGTKSGCQQDMNPANASEFVRIMSHFQTFYEIVDNADSYNFIDSDPGGWPGSPMSEQVKIFQGARTLLDKYSVKGEQTKLADWMWFGWGNHNGVCGGAVCQSTSFFEQTIASFQQNLAGPWQLVAGMSLDLAAAANCSVLQNTTFLQYNAIETEPSVPGTNLLHDKSGANPVKQMLETADQYPALGGIMGNNMIPVKLMLLSLAVPFCSFFSLSVSADARWSADDPAATHLLLLQRRMESLVRECN